MDTFAQFLLQFPRSYLMKERQVIYFNNYYCIELGGKSYLGDLDFLFKKNKCTLYVTIPRKKRFYIKKLHTFKKDSFSWSKSNRWGFSLQDNNNLAKSFNCWSN